MNTAVSLFKRVNKVYYPVVEAKNCRVKPDYVKVNGKETHMPGGTYYTSHYQGKKLIRKAVGADAAQAQAQRLKLQSDLAKGVKVQVVGSNASEDDGRIDSAVKNWLDKIAKRRDGQTWQAYNVSMEYFLEFIESRSKEYVSDISKDLLMDFHSEFLRDKRKPNGKPLSDRTVYNKFSAVVEFLKSVSITAESLDIGRDDWPKYVATRPRANTQEDIDAVMAVCNPKELLMFLFMLATGFRRGEVAHVGWRDVDIAGSTVAVSWKPEYAWKPKASKEGTVRIPKMLRDMLAEAKKTATGPLVFPAESGRPDTHLLTKLQRLAVRAGLDQKSFNVQKMRKNMATKMDRQGFTTSQLMGMMGHTSATPTARYVDAEIGPDAQAHVDAAFGL